MNNRINLSADSENRARTQTRDSDIPSPSDSSLVYHKRLALTKIIPDIEELCCEKF